MVWQERILRISRHVGRNFTLPGNEIPVPSTDLTAFAGAGVDIDGEAHILPEERERAIGIGSRMYLPEDWIAQSDVIYLAPSQLTRAKETDLALAQGLRERWNVEMLGVPAEKLRRAHTLPLEMKRRIEQGGLRFEWNPSSVLTEPVYFAWGGDIGDESRLVRDEGNQLFVESLHQDTYKGSFRYQAQMAFSGDPRCPDKPRDIADRALMWLVPELRRHRIVGGTTHTWNIEAIMATLTGRGVGTNGNELYHNAGGAFDLGGYLEVRLMVETETGEFSPQMTLARTETLDRKKELGTEYDGSKLLEEVKLSTEILAPYVTI